MPAIAISAKLTPVLLLLASNLFMTFAWYGHLRFKQVPLAGVIFASWAIALIEYCLAVPANRYGHAVYSAAELKTIQEVVTLVIFAGFSVFYLMEPLGWNHAAGFTMPGAGVFLLSQRGNATRRQIAYSAAPEAFRRRKRDAARERAGAAVLAWRSATVGRADHGGDP